MSDPDPLGRWYSLLEREHGEYMGIRFGRAPGTGGAVKWLELPHHQYDGVGGLWELHRRSYGEDGAAPILAPRDPRRPGRLITWWRFLRFLARPQTPVSAWRNLDPSWRGSLPERARPSNLVGHVLDPEQTSDLVARAQGAGVSVTSLLLWALGRAIAPALDPTRGPLRWVVPVNMRGVITRAPLTANHSSYVFAETPSGGSVQELARALRTSLAQQDHFAAWQGFTLGPALGTWIFRRMISWGIRHGGVWIGVFSNLGVWPARTDTCGSDDVWLFCPPIPRVQPLGAGVVTWRGRLALSLQTHPMLRADRAEVTQWLDAWVAEALSWRAD